MGILLLDEYRGDFPHLKIIQRDEFFQEMRNVFF